MGYEEDVIRKYRHGLNIHMDNSPINNIKLWMTDNDGQIKQNIDNKQYVGKWTHGTYTDKGGRRKLHRDV